MQWLADVSIRRPVFAWVLVFVVIVFGVIGYAKLSVDRLPKIDIPIVQITTRLDGAAPEEMETEVTEKLEEAIGTVAGVEQIDSRSRVGIFLLAVARASRYCSLSSLRPSCTLSWAMLDRGGTVC